MTADEFTEFLRSKGIQEGMPLPPGYAKNEWGSKESGKTVYLKRGNPLAEIVHTRTTDVFEIVEE